MSGQQGLRKLTREDLENATLEESIIKVLRKHDLGGGNPYLAKNHKKSYALGKIMDAIELHPELDNKSPRMKNDKLRNTLNVMISIIRVGSTRRAMYSYDSKAEEDLGSDILDKMVGALLNNGGKADWKPLQKALDVNGVMGITHIEFNSAVNYLVDNKVVRKEGSAPDKEGAREGERLTVETRKIICTSKAWGWEAERVKNYEEDEEEGGEWEKIGGSRKTSHIITLTARTSDVLDGLKEELASLPETDFRRPVKTDRSTIIEVALWNLWRDFHGSMEGEEVPSDDDGVNLSEQSLQRLGEYMSKIKDNTE